MKRELSRLQKNIQKEFLAEIKKMCKGFGFKFAHGYIYIFDGDFVYYSTLNIFFAEEPPNRLRVRGSMYIKPWRLNDIYWQSQELDMEEMRSQPKTLNFNGWFTIDDIYHNVTEISFTAAETPEEIKENTVHDNAEKLLGMFSDLIEKHKKQLTGLNVLLNVPEEYKVTNATLAMAHIYLKNDYKTAYEILTAKDPVKGYYSQVWNDGKTSLEIAAEFCERMMKA